MGAAAHWDDRYRAMGGSVSWYEEQPSTSIEPLDTLDVESEVGIIDIGGGAAMLVDHLLRAGHTDVTVLDVSSVALETARARLGDPSAVTWIQEDLLAWKPSRQWDVWRDRAVLHFLVDDNDRAAYVSLLRRSLEPAGAFVIGTFAADGPTHCSALPVRRYRDGDLAELVGNVDVVEQRRAIHRTPGAAEQPFNWIAARLRPEPPATVNADATGGMRWRRRIECNG